MNLNAVRRRVEALEQVMAIRQDYDGCLLSPYDAAVLIRERARLDSTAENSILLQRIDDLLAGHRRAIARHKPPPMAPRVAAEAMRRAAERDEDPEAAEQYQQERLTELMAP